MTESAPEAAGEVGGARSEQCLREVVGAAADELALHVPAEHAAAARVPRPRHDVVVILLLQPEVHVDAT